MSTSVKWKCPNGLLKKWQPKPIKPFQVKSQWSKEEGEEGEEVGKGREETLITGEINLSSQKLIDWKWYLGPWDLNLPREKWRQNIFLGNKSPILSLHYTVKILCNFEKEEFSGNNGIFSNLMKCLLWVDFRLRSHFKFNLI